ncbi:MAG: RagB/SusD family nutrient uptake outer membrane protein [Bacteroidales bacterium]|nr:RagB/SusD family nutrient uptake outer membrane protein [Bacteroidales bacterium]
MKRLAIISTIFILFTACEKFLEEDIKNKYVLEAWYQTESQAEASLTGVYGLLRDIYGSPNAVDFVWGTMGTDICYSVQAEMAYFVNYDFDATNNTIYNTYKKNYRVINQANSVIDRTSAMKVDEQITEGAKKRIIGEAKFLRALCYWNLVRIYGDVPLKLDETSSAEGLEIPKTAATIIYDSIVADLMKAEELMPYNTVNGRANKYAATTLLGKVYLQMTGPPVSNNSYYVNAIEKLKIVIDSCKFELLSSYADIFNLENEGHKEAIFSCAYALNEIGSNQGNQLVRFFGVAGSYTNGGCHPHYKVFIDEFVPLFDTADTRFEQNVNTVEVLNNQGVTIPLENTIISEGTVLAWNVKKWSKPLGVEPTFAETESPYDWIVLRYADVLLMYAEALNGFYGAPNPEAYDAINQVRLRAGLQELESGLSSEDFLNAVLNERVLELCYESSRKDDLFRNGKLDEVVRNIPSDGYYQDIKVTCATHYDSKRGPYWPLPQSAIDINHALEQNPDYE